MRTSVLLSFAVLASLLVVGIWAGTAVSQGTKPAAGAPEVAAIDLSKILKEHLRFKAMMDQMKKEVEAAELGLNKERDLIANMEKQLTELKRDAPNYKQREEEIFRRKSDFNYQAQLKKKDLMDKEAMIYFNIYKEINAEVAAVAQASGVSVVLRYNSETVSDASDRNGLARELAKAIVYVDQRSDMTKFIVDRLNDRAKKSLNVPDPLNPQTMRPSAVNTIPPK